MQLGVGLASAQKKEKASKNEIIIKKVEKKEVVCPLSLSVMPAVNEGLLMKGCMEQVVSWAEGDPSVTPSWGERPKPPAQKGPRHPDPPPPQAPSGRGDPGVWPCKGVLAPV